MALWSDGQLEWVWKNRQQRQRSRSLGDIVAGLVQTRVKPRQEKLAALTEAWTAMLPGELAGHTRLASLARGQLRVQVDSASHLTELNFLVRDGALLEQLREACPAAGLTQIKLTRGRW